MAYFVYKYVYKRPIATNDRILHKIDELEGDLSTITPAPSVSPSGTSSTATLSEAAGSCDESDELSLFGASHLCVCVKSVV